MTVDMSRDILRDLGPLFLGSRIKRLADRMQADATQVLEAAGLPVQPSHLPLVAALDRYGPLTVSEAVEALGISQPAVTRTATALVDLDLIEMPRTASDQRQKRMVLTATGRALLARIRTELWPQIGAAADDLCDGPAAPLMQQIEALEDKLERRSLAKRIADHAAVLASHAEPGGLAIREFSDDLAGTFYSLNAEWIEAMFTLEDNDRAILSDPRGLIVDRGGVVLFVEATGLGIVGTVALIKIEEGVFELTKMAVTPRARGRKAGEFLLAAVLERAKAMAIDELYLLTHPKCEAAIHLYERMGFVHDDEVLRRRSGRYTRAKVGMRYPRERLASAVVVRPAREAADLAAVQALFRDYEIDIGIDLGVQDFAAETSGLPGRYAPPQGELFLAQATDGRAVGCVALKPFRAGEVCELKRLFVRPEGRGAALGRRLVDAAIDVARATGYREVVLDTIPQLAPAIALYERMGFVRTPAYWDNPVPDTIYFRKYLGA